MSYLDAVAARAGAPIAGAVAEPLVRPVDALTRLPRPSDLDGDAATETTPLHPARQDRSPRRRVPPPPDPRSPVPPAPAVAADVAARDRPPAGPADAHALPTRATRPPPHADAEASAVPPPPAQTILRTEVHDHHHHHHHEPDPADATRATTRPSAPDPPAFERAATAPTDTATPTPPMTRPLPPPVDGLVVPPATDDTLPAARPVEVRIGRIVVAGPDRPRRQPPRQHQRTADGATRSLADYLERRRGEGER